MRKGLTLIEITVVLCILFVILLLLVPLFQQYEYKNNQQLQVDDYFCIKTYVIGQVRMVDLKNKNEEITTMICVDNATSTTDSASRYAAIAESKWYKITSDGVRDTKRYMFPNITKVEELK